MTSSSVIAPSGFLHLPFSPPPALHVYLNLDNLSGLRNDTIWPGKDGEERFAQLKQDGFQGVQFTDGRPRANAASLPYCGLGRISTPEQADAVARKHKELGDNCITVHAGWGMEDDVETDRIVEAILRASHRYELPIFVETHRATVTQDLWRTVQLLKRFPQLRLNGDFSHYYCGQELTYGDWNARMAFMAPVLERVAFLHGRIASSGSMQVTIDKDLGKRPKAAYGEINYLEHFREMWTRAMLGFLRKADKGDVLIFAPELLPPTYYYARMISDQNGGVQEESDRYQQALLLKMLARECFAEAQALFQNENARANTEESSPASLPGGGL